MFGFDEEAEQKNVLNTGKSAAAGKMRFRCSRQFENLNAKLRIRLICDLKK